MMDDLKIYERLSDLLYKDLLGMASKEEKQELDSLCEEYGVKEMDRDEIVARLQGTDDFDGREAYRKFKILKKNERKTFRIGWWVSTAASVVVLCIVGWWLNNGPEQIKKVEPVVAEIICPGQSCAVITLADGKQVSLEENIQELKESDGTILRSEFGTLVYKANLHNETAEVMYNTVTIPRGGEYCLELADGTKVWLNAETELRFPVNFSDKTRDVYLKGEAYFQVSKDELHAFQVHTSMGTVAVLGTSFNVRDYADEQKVVTTLEMGKVMYVSGENKKEIILTPGFQVQEEKTGEIKMKKVDVMQYVGWREGKYVFENTALVDIMRTLERWYDIDVVYVDPVVKDYHFTGDLERYESINVFLNFIETGGDVKFKMEGKTIIIGKK
ncbi:FecR family protein [Butyricimonas virosa]|jgi:putative anti-sigma factor|uniref:FecR family protein n=1 Tax=Butyricimonas virosa TaxID=544645 RepID=A0A413INQ4_9BACT|nr:MULTISPECIES: FecR family protein [Butyricimonas]MBO4959481.1 DUF4974 domain-containing protein [Butyricimonas sp.]MCI6414927.1 FecR family protein [Butyricimonas virosa]MCI7164894.1 FecR family protein [Butyricimonas virosa]MDY5013639.1 FecR family protein [Butyricimonas virosa]RGY18248.1 FecR family protein [Butyricimonas virosa]